MTSIVSTLVSNKLRTYFLPVHFGRWMMRAEGAIYDTLGSFSKTYQGGYWHFYELSNGGFYMAPAMDEPLRVFIPGNGYEGEVSADAAGIIATLFVLCSLSHSTEEDRFIRGYHCLLDFAEQHMESAAIFAAID
ncbi:MULTISPECIES: antirestriction protein [Legionella]|uniref:antirestriction protein n=1 Tax=Legionella TaxID=445 RepID=UPI0010417F8C|nr:MULTISPECIES: antirestriction protein [Legionella]